MGKNIVTGKIGRSAYFDRKKWKDAAGNNEYPILLSALAKLNPHNTYFLIGKSDLSRCSKEVYDYWFPNGNVVDVWADFDKKLHDPTTFIWEKLKYRDIDYGIIHGGMCSLSIPNKIYCLDRKTKQPIFGKLRQPIQSLVNYVSPITYYLNASKIDWMTFTSDGRYMPLPARDLINPEKISFGVKEGEVEIERMKSYEDQGTMVRHKVKLRYGAAEFQYLLDPKWGTYRDSKKTQKIAVFFHQYDNKKRIKALEEFIFNNFNEDELAVYGKWDTEKYNGPKFKGSVTFDSLQEILPSVKYTFCYPIIDGDISGKWVEAAVNGIIPFFHTSYDKDRLLIKHHHIPHWLYVSSPQELREKIEYLETHSNGYEKMKKMLKDIVDSDSWRIGKVFNKLINAAAQEMADERWRKNYQRRNNNR